MRENMYKQMRYLAGALLATASLANAGICDSKSEKLTSAKQEISGKSYLYVRSPFTSFTPELTSAARHTWIHGKEDGRHGAFQAVLFGGKSMDSDKLVRYFTPFAKTTLIVDSRITDENGDPVQKDLLAQHFNIFTTSDEEYFRSEIAFEPKQSLVGLGVHYRQSFWRNEDKGRGFFFSASSPLLHIKNQFNISETIIHQGTIDTVANKGVVSNMVEAFMQPAWFYGRIESDQPPCSGAQKACGEEGCPDSKTRLGDIEVKLGMEWLEHEPCHLESYVGMLIPTGNKAKGVCIFEPIVGAGKHFGLMFGGAFGLRIWVDEENDRNLRMEYAMNSQYLFKNTQVRSFDLINKPFSRYAQLYLSKADAINASQLTAPLNTNSFTPGINVLTQTVKVTPGYQFNINSAFVYTCATGFQGEAGYNFYARRGEDIELCKEWQVGPALKHVLGNGLTNPIRNISGFVMQEDENDNYTDVTSLANYENNVILASDIDLDSAATPAALSHTFYGAVGYRWGECENPVFASFGGSVEISKANNTELERWLAWGKVGFTF
jgi:hypothetical protein